MTGQEAALFRILLAAKGRTISKEGLLSELYSRKFYADGEIPEIKIIDVFICKLRKKLEPMGLVIETAWGKGYYLEEPGEKEAA